MRTREATQAGAGARATHDKTCAIDGPGVRWFDLLVSEGEQSAFD